MGSCLKTKEMLGEKERGGVGVCGQLTSNPKGGEVILVLL